jgi:hypothetical protein
MARTSASPGNADGGAVYNLAFGNNITTGGAVSAAATITDSILSNSTGGVDLVNNVFNGSTNGNSATVNLNGPNLVMSLNNISGTLNGSPTVTSDPQLGALQNNGGPTPTMAITTSSPAFHAGMPVAGITTDQRGVMRPDTPSLGAFEPLVVPPSPPPSPAATTIQLTTLHIVPNLLNLMAQVTLTAQVSSPAGTANEGLVTFTLAGLSVQGTVQNGTANAQVVLPLIDLASNLVVQLSISSTYADNSTSPSFGPSNAVTPVVFNVWNALLPSTVTLSGGSEHNVIPFLFTALEFFYVNQQWTAFQFGPLALQVQYTALGDIVLLTLNGLPQQVLFFAPQGQFLGAVTLALSDVVPVLMADTSGQQFLNAALLALSGSGGPNLLLSDAGGQVVGTVPL